MAELQTEMSGQVQPSASAIENESGSQGSTLNVSPVHEGDLGDENPDDVEYSDYEIPNMRPDLLMGVDEDDPIEDDELSDEDPLVSSDEETPEPGFSVPELTGSTEGAEENAQPISRFSSAGEAGGSEPPASLTIEEARRRIFTRHNTTISDDDPILLLVTILAAGQERDKDISNWFRQKLVEVVTASQTRFEQAARKLASELYSQSSEAAAEVIATNLKEMSREAGGVTETLAEMKRVARRTIGAMSFLTLIVVVSVFAIYIILQ